MNLLFTLCARAGSKGVKSKNSRIFMGYPLVYYTLSAYESFKSKYGSGYNHIDLALNTDSAQVLEQCRNAKTAFEYISREQILGGDKVAKADVIRDTLQKMECRTKKKYEVISDLDLTSPLRTVDDINGCLQALVKSEKANVAYSVTHARRQPHFNMVMKNEEGYMERIIKGGFLTRQDAPQCFDMNASIYAYKREPLLNNVNNSIFDGRAVAWVMKDTAVLDIDSEEDFELLQILAGYFFDNYADYRNIRDNIKNITG